MDPIVTSSQTEQPARIWLGLVFWLALVYAAAALGSWVTMPEIPTWYAGLAKPAFNPPNWIFGPVWTTLYTLMGIGAWLVWRRHGVRGAAVPLTIFLLQLVLNTLWSFLFFGQHHLLAALIDIGLLWLAIMAMLVAFQRKHPWAGWLQLPYLLWVSFAAVLNFEIWRLNG